MIGEMMNVPDGWKLVPIEPVIAMVVAGCKSGQKHGNNPYYMYIDMLAAAPAAPVAAPAPSEWISVADRLPEMDVQVLVFCPNNGDPRTEFDEWTEYHEDPIGMGGPTICTGEGWSNNEFEEITHWMPLPVAPDPFAGIAADFSADCMLTTKEPPCAE